MSSDQVERLAALIEHEDRQCPASVRSYDMIERQMKLEKLRLMVKILEELQAIKARLNEMNLPHRS